MPSFQILPGPQQNNINQELQLALSAINSLGQTLEQGRIAKEDKAINQIISNVSPFDQSGARKSQAQMQQEVNQGISQFRSTQPSGFFAALDPNAASRRGISPTEKAITKQRLTNILDPTIELRKNRLQQQLNIAEESRVSAEERAKIRGITTATAKENLGIKQDARIPREEQEKARESAAEIVRLNNEIANLNLVIAKRKESSITAETIKEDRDLKRRLDAARASQLESDALVKQATAGGSGIKQPTTTAQQSMRTSTKNFLLDNIALETGSKVTDLKTSGNIKKFVANIEKNLIKHSSSMFDHIQSFNTTDREKESQLKSSLNEFPEQFRERVSNIYAAKAEGVDVLKNKKDVTDFVSDRYIPDMRDPLSSTKGEIRNIQMDVNNIKLDNLKLDYARKFSGLSDIEANLVSELFSSNKSLKEQDIVALNDLITKDPSFEDQDLENDIVDKIISGIPGGNEDEELKDELTDKLNEVFLIALKNSSTNIKYKKNYKEILAVLKNSNNPLAIMNNILSSK